MRITPGPRKKRRQAGKKHERSLEPTTLALLYGYWRRGSREVGKPRGVEKAGVRGSPRLNYAFVLKIGGPDKASHEEKKREEHVKTAVHEGRITRKPRWGRIPIGRLRSPLMEAL